MYQACLFDLDGTLVNSLADLAQATNHALNVLGHPTHDTPRYRYFVGDGVAKLLERALPEAARTPETLARARELFDAFYAAHRFDHTAPYDGMLPLLDALAARGLSLGVVTNKPEPAAKEIVSKLFGGRFTAVTGNRPGLPRKPDAHPALEAAATLGVQPAGCLFIGDSGVDMQTAAVAGMTGVGVLWGFRESAELLGCGAKKLVASPEELLALL